MKMQLGIIDFGFFKPPKIQAYQVINSLFSEISFYESIGYKRYWLSEHFSYEFSWYSPEMLMPLLAGYSNTIKIGWTGVLMNFHSPILIASNLKLLAALFDNRIDLGFSSASISPDFKKYILQNIHPFDELVETTVNLLRSKITDSSLDKINIPPHGTEPPTVWILGVSENSINLPLKLDTNLALSLIHPKASLSANLDTIKRFNDNYFKIYNKLPVSSILVSAHCTENKRIQKVLNYHYNSNDRCSFFGSADYIVENLMKLQTQLENSEFTLHSPICDRNERMKSFENIISKLNDI